MGLSTGNGLVNLQYLVGRALSSCLQMHQCCPAQGVRGHTPHTSCKGTEKVSSHTQSMHQPITLFTRTDVKSVIQKKLESMSWQRGHSAITYPVPEPPEAQSRSHQKDIWSKSLNFKFCFNCQTIDALVEDCLFSQHCCRTTVPHPSLNSTQVCCCFSIRFHLQSAAITGR